MDHDEFFLIEYRTGSFEVCPNPEHAEARWTDLAAIYKTVRMLRCRLTEIVKEQS